MLDTVMKETNTDFNGRTWKPYLLLLVYIVLFSLSCSSTLNLRTVDSLYQSSDYQRAFTEIENLEKVFLKTQGPLVYALDAGLMAHFAGHWDESNMFLTNAERIIRENFTESVTANIATFLVNDNVRDYQGEDYEDIYANIFKALNYYHLGQFESSRVELRRSTEKQALLKSKYERLLQSANKLASEKGQPEVSVEPISIEFSNSALSNYLQMIIARDTNDYVDALFSYNQIEEAFSRQPGLYDFPIPISVMKELDPIPTSEVRLNTIAFSGLAPVKMERITHIEVSPYNYAKIALPVMIDRSSQVSAVEVRISNGISIELQLLENIAKIALETFKLHVQYIETKTWIRSLLKSAGTAIIDSTTNRLSEDAETEELSQLYSLVGGVLGLISRISNYASEQADIRISHYFPAKAWVGGVNIRPGIYDVEFIYKDSRGKIVHVEQISRMRFYADRPNILESICPY
jgi:uncharacterized protein